MIKNTGIENMEDEKKLIEKRSSFRGWKERNKGKSNQKKYIIGIAAAVLILSIFIIYPSVDKKENVSIPAINVNSSTVTNNSSLIMATPKITAPKTTPVVTPEITRNILGKMGTPFVINGFEINVTKADSSFLYTNIWIIAKNIEDVEKPFKIGLSTVLIDNIGLQYERVQVKRSAEIVQSNLAAKAMRDGAIFFEPVREGRSPKKLILEINGQKAEVMIEE